MKKRLNIWSNLPERMLPERKYLWAYFFISLLMPLIIIIQSRVYPSIHYLYMPTQFFALLLVVHIHKKIRSGNYNFESYSTFNSGILYKIGKFVLFYITLPYICFFTNNIIIQLIPKSILETNIQGLSSSVPKSNLKSDLISSILASTEEVWKVVTIFIVIFLCNKINNNQKYKWLYLFIGLLITSFIFGWIHTFGYSEHWFSLKITAVLGIFGLMDTILILITRRFISVMISHSLFDVASTLFRSPYNDITNKWLLNIFLISSLISLTFIVFYFLNKKKPKLN